MITDLTLQALGDEQTLLPLLSCRNCIQTLTPIPQGGLRRTVNGDLVSTGLPHHTKYYSKIKGKDKLSPALEHSWKGTQYLVGCLSILTQPLNHESSILLSRDPIPGSVTLTSQEGEIQDLDSIQDRRVTLPETLPNGFINYRPILRMCVLDFQTHTDEMGMVTHWELELEEV